MNGSQMETDRRDGGYFRELNDLINELSSVPCVSLTADQLEHLCSYIKQVTEAVSAGGGDINEDVASEVFSIVAMSSMICLCVDKLQTAKTPSTEAILGQLKEVFYNANGLFTATITWCKSNDVRVKELKDIFAFVRHCRNLDAKIFLQVSKTFVSLLDGTNGNTAVEDDDAFSAYKFAEFLQSVILNDFVLPAKRSPTAIKVASILLRTLASLYSSCGSEIFQTAEKLSASLCFLIEMHASYFELMKPGGDSAEAIITAYNQYILPAYNIILQSLLHHELFISVIIDYSGPSQTAMLCVILNIFCVLSESKTISETNGTDDLLRCFLRKFPGWANEAGSLENWPWPIIGCLKKSSVHELSAYIVARFVICSALEEATKFFALEKLLLLALVGKGPEDYSIMTRIFVADIFAIVANSSLKLSLRYVSLLSQFVTKTSESNDLTGFLVTTLLRKVFDTLDDENKSKWVASAVDELNKLSATCGISTSIARGRRPSGISSTTEIFRLLENCSTALTKPSSPFDVIFIPTVRLYAYLTWWSLASPELLKNSKSILEKITFTMWSILSTTTTPLPSNSSDKDSTSGCHAVLILFAQAVVEASKAAIIGINNYENSAKFWAAANQFFEITPISPAVKQLFIIWMLKTIDNNTLCNSSGAQQLFENCLDSDADLLGAPRTSVAMMMKGIVLSNLANRLTMKNAPMTKLNAKLRLQAEAFSQKLFCIPFSQLANCSQQQQT